ncbi:hypothetical protein [[Flexibacter] sp. ATCC 35103]|uniref:hypothetical protein n=1 Tax=[Flexibacter] sp. ATCC 35103 TaxID=1937528 RepID=UPI0009C697AB|nr:hypothetical protein [[Flexibacter] sp. ATCC 35103]OMQ09299.1 hypothetical protein BXU01_18220 [[Flexibacter] sp. ATCC 35103]OMQ09312.1 hypothetical protein BXU01_18285 [[Flexibacter] sp. ATCC 35103]
MINKEIAYNRINTVLLEMEKEVGVKLKINDDYFYDFHDFMFFIYNSFEYLINDNNSYALAGNLPLIIDKNEGNIYTLIDFTDELEDFKFEELLLNGFLEKINPAPQSL